MRKINDYAFCKTHKDSIYGTMHGNAADLISAILEGRQTISPEEALLNRAIGYHLRKTGYDREDGKEIREFIRSNEELCGRILYEYLFDED